MGYNTKNYLTDNGDELVIGGTLTVSDGATVTGLTETAAAASAAALGGVKAADRSAETDTVEIKIGTDSKLYAPAYTVLAAATATDLGGIIAAGRTAETDTVEIKIGTDSKLYAPALTAAAASTLGGVMAANRTAETDTVEVKIGTDSKLYAPVYPTVPVATNQVDSIEVTSPTVAEFNALLLKLKTAGLMEDDS